MTAKSDGASALPSGGTAAPVAEELLPMAGGSALGQICAAQGPAHAETQASPQAATFGAVN